MAEAKTNENNENGFQIESLLTTENLRMIGIFLVILVVAAILANLTRNDTLRADTASDIPGDIEDIGDTAFDVLEAVQENAQAIASDVSLTTDPEAFQALVSETLEEDSLENVSRMGIYQPEGTNIALEIVDGSTVGVLGEDAVPETINVEQATGDDETTRWSVLEDGVQYVTPVGDTDAFIWAQIADDTLNNLLTEGALGEDLFEDTQNGYALLVTGDNEIIAHFNAESVTASQVSNLVDSLSEDVFNEEEEYYEIESDPVLDDGSFAAMMESDITDWRVVGAYPWTEVPNETIVESTMNLFDASEAGETVSAAVDSAVEFLNEDAGWLFRGLRVPIEMVILAVEDVLLAIHWSIVIALTTIVAALSGGRKVAYISAFGMFAIGMLGLWDLTMTTMAMLLTSMGFCVLVGIPVGIWAARNDRVNEIVRSVLDAMQTIHPFVYLVPIVILFGIGKVPGTIATIIFALPPMVRLTNLGIRQVPEDVIEAARAFGSNDWQLLRDVQIPLAMPSIMAGVNQTLMLSLSMVVIVALIAGGGLGQEIYRAIQNSDIGRAVVSGVAVLLLAVVIDRISQGQAAPREAAEE